MLIEFHKRTPGQHAVFHSAHWDTVPRVGEQVAMTDDSEVLTVHSVTYIVGRAMAIVLLREQW